MFDLVQYHSVSIYIFEYHSSEPVSTIIYYVK